MWCLRDKGATAEIEQEALAEFQAAADKADAEGHAAAEAKAEAEALAASKGTQIAEMEQEPHKCPAICVV